MAVNSCASQARKRRRVRRVPSAFKLRSLTAEGQEYLRSPELGFPSRNLVEASGPVKGFGLLSLPYKSQRWSSGCLFGHVKARCGLSCILAQSCLAHSELSSFGRWLVGCWTSEIRQAFRERQTPQALELEGRARSCCVSDRALDSWMVLSQADGQQLFHQL